jgi:hypothetical protein
MPVKVRRLGFVGVGAGTDETADARGDPVTPHLWMEVFPLFWTTGMVAATELLRRTDEVYAMFFPAVVTWWEFFNWYLHVIAYWRSPLSAPSFAASGSGLADCQ